MSGFDDAPSGNHRQMKTPEDAVFQGENHSLYFKSTDFGSDKVDRQGVSESG